VLAAGVEAIPPSGGWYSTIGALGDAAHVVGDAGSARLVAEALAPYILQGESVSEPIDVIRAELALTLDEPAPAAEIAAGAAAHAQTHDAPIFAGCAFLEAAAHHRLDLPVSGDNALTQATAIAQRTHSSADQT
jgi:hypothetical protein